ncbi:hypothetical protein CJD48_08660 [Bifidobacterium bifidum]|uniref:Uncharacterized protein n=1 Tax=Bifidobacterium bifidum TaxID=1681 RepID=A0A415C407_BIFBI|nr:hypothetical protein CJD48_08660 [Bifidobacterium bifidum]OKY90030.1 MAG: hypothetical protein BHV59_01340 [Bifidobacterium sp. 56_9_plus]PVV35071.1 hypothetical protein DD686_00360 [Bifidobacterium bifidum]PVV37399.1 hypothetical protein DD684_07595 [Bifidobacterium bifidum]RGJ40844.1 hypothetical protein DXD62_01300 [Bifidobacterium bifidum]
MFLPWYGTQSATCLMDRDKIYRILIQAVSGMVALFKPRLRGLHADREMHRDVEIVMDCEV